MKRARNVSIFTDATNEHTRGAHLGAYVGSTRFVVVTVRGRDVARLEVTEWADGEVYVTLGELSGIWKHATGTGPRTRFVKIRP